MKARLLQAFRQPRYVHHPELDFSFYGHRKQ
jgi:hypothetical protein